MKIEDEDTGIWTWRREIERDMAYYGDSLANVEHCTLSQEQLDAEVKFGGPNLDFGIWTHTRVYFGVAAEGHYSCESVPRNPGRSGGTIPILVLVP